MTAGSTLTLAVAEGCKFRPVILEVTRLLAHVLIGGGDLTSKLRNTRGKSSELDC